MQAKDTRCRRSLMIAEDSGDSSYIKGTHNIGNAGTWPSM